MTRQKRTYLPVILCILAGNQTSNASLELACTVCSETHPELNITCTWDTQPGVSYSPFFKLQQGTSCTSYTTWQVCSSSAEGSCEIPFLHCESSFDRFQVKVETSNSELETVSFYKNEIAKPHPPEDLTVNPGSDSYTQLTVQWKMPECTDMMFNSYTCQVEYTSEQDVTRTSETSVDFNPEASKELRDLTPCTLYRVRVRCKPVLGAHDGWGEFTKTVKAQTNSADYDTCLQEPDPPRGLSVMAISDNNLQLSWQPPVKSYIIMWCELETDAKCVGPEQNMSVAGSEMSIKVSDSWRPLTRYRFVVKAVNSAGQSESSNPALGYAVQGVPSSPPQNVTVEAATSTSLLVSWKPPPLQDRRGFITKYMVYYYVTPTVRGQQMSAVEQSEEVNITDDSQPLHFSLSELQPFTFYTVRLSAVTSQGEGSKTQPKGAQTRQAAPSAPTDVIIYNVTVNTMTITWAPPSQPNGIIRYYNLKYGNNSRKLEGNHTVFMLDRLEGDTNYSIQVQGCTEANPSCGPLSPVQHRLTKVGAPGIVQDLQAKFDPTNGDISITWTPPAMKNGRDIRYIISNGQKDIAVTSITHWTTDKLDNTCSDRLPLLFRVHARTRDPVTGQEFDGPESAEYLSCEDRLDIQGVGHLALEAKLLIILAVLVVCMVGLAALVLKFRKMLAMNVPGPADFITDMFQDTDYDILEGRQTLNNLHIVSEQTGKAPEILDDYSQLLVEHKCLHGFDCRSEYGDDNADFNTTHSSVGSCSISYIDLSDENTTLPSDTIKARNLASKNQPSDVGNYSKHADVGRNFKDWKANYVTEQDLNTVSQDGSKPRRSIGSLGTTTDYSNMTAERGDQRMDLDVSYVRNSGMNWKEY